MLSAVTGFLNVIISRSIKRSISVFSLAACLVVFFGSISFGGPLLSTSGLLSTANPPPLPPYQFRATAGNLTTGPWTGTWTSPVLVPWSGGTSGTFNATGPLPNGTGPTGTATYDFTTLPNGNLPVGTFFAFGDLDNGSAAIERFELRAFDVLGDVVTTAWLGDTVGVSTTVVADDMPAYSFDGGTGVYVFDGSSVPNNPNPSVTFFLDSHTAIFGLEVNRFSIFANFALAAPVPEPSSFILLCCGAACAAGSLLVRGVKRRNRRNRRTTALT